MGGNTAQAKALVNYRKRLKKRGIARFEVLGLESDRELIRDLARRLSENDGEAAAIRASIRERIVPMSSKKGGLLEMLRNSPLAGVDLDLVRKRVSARKVEL